MMFLCCFEKEQLAMLGSAQCRMEHVSCNAVTGNALYISATQERSNCSLRFVACNIPTLELVGKYSVCVTRTSASFFPNTKSGASECVRDEITGHLRQRYSFSKFFTLSCAAKPNHNHLALVSSLWLRGFILFHCTQTKILILGNLALYNLCSVEVR